MPSDAQIATAVCALLVGRELKARELIKLLTEQGVEIERRDLNSVLYRVKDQTPGLSVADGVWSFVPPDASKPKGRQGTRPVPASPRPPKAPTDRAPAVPAVAPPSQAADGLPHGWGDLASEPPPPPPPFERSLEQADVIEAPPTQWTLVEAGPGTGKTAVALARVAHLLNVGVPPDRILVVSFTRTAVAELRQRIEARAKDVAAAASVRITTLDSEAWNLGTSFRGETAGDRVARGFDGNIDDAITMFKCHDPMLCEWMAQTQHVIIDEAQDLVGRRAELVFQLLDHLADACGVTVFVDPAQAIYGFGDRDGDEDDRAHGKRERPFHEKLLKDFRGQFVETKLTSLYRSSDPTLRHIFEHGRAIALGDEPPTSRLANLRDMAQASGRTVLSVDKRASFGSDELVLFRRRSEVLLASSFLAGNAVPHRIRMAQTSLGAHPWLACLLGTEPATAIDRAELERRWANAATSPHLRGVTLDQVWHLLHRLGATNSGAALDVRALRRLLSRARPPVELMQTEVGATGPILGTIHASKGREASTVSLMLANVRDGDDDDDVAQEVRVTYVGVTRARHTLLVGKGYAGYGFKTLGRGGRVYRVVKQGGPGRIQVELGRPGDVDELATVSKTRFTADEVRRAQTYLAAYAYAVVTLSVTSDADYTYLLRTPEGLPLGALTTTVNKDLFSIAKAIEPGVGRKPPGTIPNVSLVGVRTFAVTDDHPRLAEVCEPWATTGVFLVPVIRALTTMNLPPRGAKRDR